MFVMSMILVALGLGIKLDGHVEDGYKIVECRFNYIKRMASSIFVPLQPAISLSSIYRSFHCQVVLACGVELPIVTAK